MPIYEYQAKHPATRGCPFCRQPFEILQPITAPALTHCPECARPLTKLISAPSVGASKSGFDDRAKSSGFHKLQKIGKGEYEKIY